MPLLEDLVAGALTTGVNKPTLLVLNLALVGCVLILVSLLFVTASSAPDLLPHLAVLLVFALGLIASVNWLVGQLGTVPASQQREELFGKPADTSAQAAQQAQQTQQQGSGAELQGEEKKAQ